MTLSTRYWRFSALFVCLCVCEIGRGEEAAKRFDCPTEMLGDLCHLAWRGDGYAMFRIGAAYARGDRVPASEATARVWLFRAAEADYVPAMSDLGIYLLTGFGGEKDSNAGMKWLERAAALQYGPAMVNIGATYHSNSDFERAKYWFEKAIGVGSTTGLVNLATLYARGEGVDKSCDEARRLFQKAINAGDGEALASFHFFFRPGRDAGSIRIKAKEIIGGMKIENVGESSYCGTLGAGGPVTIDSPKLTDFNSDISSKGGSSLGGNPSRPPKNDP